MEIQIGNKIVEVTLISKEGNKVSVDINGEIYEVDCAMFDNGTCSIIHNGNSYRAEMVKSDNGKHYKVNMNYSTYQIDMLDSQAKYMRMKKKGGEEQQSDTIKAPMPGKVVRIYCKEGQTLAKGDTIMTMEAMKMQSNIQVIAPCTVREIKVKEGDNVNVDQTLIRLDVDNN